VQSVTKVAGMAFLADEVEAIIDAALAGTLDEDERDKAKFARLAAATVGSGVGGSALND
jgi:2-oxoglutarate ferredoxin oxidoreductase subunit alpha